MKLYLHEAARHRIEEFKKYRWKKEEPEEHVLVYEPCSHEADRDRYLTMFTIHFDEKGRMMTPNQKHAEEQYQKDMPKLKELRDQMAKLATVNTIHEVIEVFRGLGILGVITMDEIIDEKEKQYRREMHRGGF